MPELYLNGGFTPLKESSVAKVFDSDGKVISVYLLENKNNIWEWKKIQ